MCQKGLVQHYSCLHLVVHQKDLLVCHWTGMCRMDSVHFLDQGRNRLKWEMLVCQTDLAERRYCLLVPQTDWVVRMENCPTYSVARHCSFPVRERDRLGRESSVGQMDLVDCSQHVIALQMGRQGCQVVQDRQRDSVDYYSYHLLAH